ncbi:DnaJ-class molecular chaperone with C-terminal Zn finger domain [Ruminococcus sp. SR1/5]|uniref:DnaJ-class molecular chaperone with C-terminal Zn finger domain n=1 Tax=Ruminococcus sp. SR1/5 TaxID=657323 RepID=UPI0001CD5F52|nr:DnaJ-class molecular chaperone with C-terminal Zn finger domain [Ruminococcus sp. SR1/5]
MAVKRDYYDVLGIDRNADEKTIKKPIVNWPKNIIRIQTPVMQMPQINLKK